MDGRRERRNREREIDEELRAHLELEEQEQLARGLSRDEAHAAARRALGNVQLVREDVRAAWGWPFIEQCAQDVRYAFRVLRAAPGYALTAILSLALGLGLNVGIFSLADALVFRPLPVRDAGSLLAVRSTSPEQPFGGISYLDFKDFRENSRSFETLIAHRLWVLPVASTADAVPQMRMCMKVTGDFFQALGIEPVLGRGFLRDEEVAGRDAVAVLSHEFWLNEFHGDPHVVGRQIYVKQMPVTVVGVAPPEFTGMDPIIRPFMYVPVTFGETLTGATSGSTPVSVLERRDERGFVVRGRLRQGVTRAEAQAELTALARALEQQYPDTNRRRGVAVRSELELRSEQAPALLPMVVLLLSLSGLVLVIVCANLANLVLSRARARSREIAIRLAIGAGRLRLLRQLLTESAVLAAIGGAAGVGVAFGIARYLRSIQIPTDTPMVIGTQIDSRVLWFSVAAAAFCVLAFGLFPAWSAGRADLVSSLKAIDGSGRHRMLGRRALVVAQVALTLVLLAATGLMVDAFRRMTVLDPGFRTERVLMMEFDPSAIGYTDQRTRDFYRTLIDRTRALPGVRSAALSRAIPFRPSFTEELIVPEGFELPPGQEGVRITTNTVGDQYFETMGIPIIAGRALTSLDRSGSMLTAVVNDTFARTYWPHQDPLGKRFRLGAQGPWITVVGVSRTTKILNIAEAPQPYIYLPLDQHPTNRLTLLAHTATDPVAFAEPLRELLRSIDPHLPIANTRSLQSVYSDGALGIQRIVLQMVSSMGGLALGLAVIGLYALVAYSVRLRMREFGVRMSIGATPGDIRRLVLRDGAGVAALGVAIGLLLSLPVRKALGAALAGVGPLSPWVMLIVPVALMAVAMAACLGPARFASSVDPTTVLRLE